MAAVGVPLGVWLRLTEGGSWKLGSGRVASGGVLLGPRVREAPVVHKSHKLTALMLAIPVAEVLPNY